MEARSVHLVGIGGSGMSAIARILLARGATVTGSEMTRSPLVERLEREGARIAIGHAGENVGDVDRVVASSAIRADNPERIAARERGIPVLSRGTMLAELIGDRPCIAVAGTHGKTTTTAMLAIVLERGGLDPTVAVGGERVDTQTNARDGAGTWFLTESDESDGSFLELRPTLAVITNIENDHVADDRAMERLVSQFDRFLATIPAHGFVAISVDNPRSAALARRTKTTRVGTFGIDAPADIVATGVRFEGLGSAFGVACRGSMLGSCTLGVPGAINIQNALAAIAVAREAGVPFETIAAALADFRGVRRRFDILARTEAMTVVDDYAHHPTAVAETIAAARAVSAGPLIVAFQPHRYTRTAYLATDFARALAGADEIYLTPIYAAAESPIEGIDERSIGEPLAASGSIVRYAAVDDLPALLQANVPRGALVLMLGAGSITHRAHDLAARVAPAAALA